MHKVHLYCKQKDIAFIEYEDEGSATVVKDALINTIPN